ncbi:MAG: Na/Pi cotransporter family protein, partial [Planctomycetota bacterium]
MIPNLLGGLGLFMLGMLLMTEGLQLVAGGALRSLLRRFTKGRLTGVLTGAAGTALVQSSSATTLLTIGFVNAKLLTFHQAVGLIYGANLGTTTTAWIVALLGFKVDISVVALPMVGVGILLRLAGRGRVAGLGTALAGFGLVFVGIEFLQEGMDGVAQRFDLAQLGTGSTLGRLGLVGVGALITAVMQSSSAAMAATLTALFSGAITLPQAACIVVGQNVGTTVTAMLGAVGGSASARRTAAAHVLFNLTTAGLVFAAIDPLTRRLVSLGDSLGWDPPTTLSAFHSAFNLLGVILFLPVTRPFAYVLERLVPERGRRLVRRLDAALLPSPALAVEAARLTVVDITREVVQVVRRLLAGEQSARFTEGRLEVTESALSKARDYLALLRSAQEPVPTYQHHLSLFHAVDHVQRLIDACREPAHTELVRAVEELGAIAQKVSAGLEPVEAWLRDREAPPALPAAQELSQAVAEERRGFRRGLLERTAASELEPRA